MLSSPSESSDPSLALASNESVPYSKSDSSNQGSLEYLSNNQLFEKIPSEEDEEAVKEWSLEQMETVSLEVEDELPNPENMVILNTVSFENEAEVLEKDGISEMAPQSLQSCFPDPSAANGVVADTLPSREMFNESMTLSSRGGQNSAMLASYYVAPTLTESQFQEDEFGTVGVERETVDNIVSGVSAISLENGVFKSHPSMAVGPTQGVVDDSQATSIPARVYCMSEIPNAQSAFKQEDSNCSSGLSKFFAEEKFGSDREGKAFFDALAETVSLPGTSGLYAGGVNQYASHDLSLLVNDVDEESEYYDAWIPKASTKQALMTMAASPPGTFFPEKEQLTMPGVIITEDLRDPIRDLARQYLGETTATQRVILTADNVSQDEEGLIKLVSVGCYRAAVNLTTRLLATHGQGLKKSGHPSRHSLQSLHLWLLRLSLLARLRLFNMAEAESEPFGDLDRPDLYYEFYPEIYGNRRGTMVPFSLRLLLPQILTCVGKFGEALDRLYSIWNTVKKTLKKNLPQTEMIDNLEKGLKEDGSWGELSESRKRASLELWKKREVKVMYGVTNYLVAQNDFTSAYSLLESILNMTPENTANIRSAQGHVLLQLGDVKFAQASFALSAATRGDSVKEKLATLVDRALLMIAGNNFSDALTVLKEAQELDPENPVVVNNMAVCLLYTGKLRAAFQLLETAIANNPKLYVHECILVNICTLYDLESSRSMQKKSNILEVVSRHAGDGFNVFCLKLQNAT